MSRPNPAVFIAFLVAVIVVLGSVTLAKGGFYLAKHEGDTLHLLQILFRMASGEWPHLDFMTPIGLLAFAPVVVPASYTAWLATASMSVSEYAPSGSVRRSLNAFQSCASLSHSFSSSERSAEGAASTQGDFADGLILQSIGGGGGNGGDFQGASLASVVSVQAKAKN